MTNKHPIQRAEGTTVDAGPTSSSQPVRIFVGIKVAPEIARQLALFAKREDVPCRYVPADDLHLTLVPPWNEASVAEAVGTLRKALERFGRFSLIFERLCYGPAPRRPRMLWAECVLNAEIGALRHALLNAFGQENERPFRPHVTLARIGITGRTAAEKNPVDQALCFTQPVNSVELFRSPTPGESGYEVVVSLPLKDVVTTRG